MTTRTRLAAAVLVAAVGAARTAAAHPYETFVDIQDVDDLYDLQATGQITDDTFDALLDLLQRGVDLNEADRDELYSLPNLTYDDVDAIIAYRTARGRINDPADLVGAGALSQDKLLAISAFLIVREAHPSAWAAHGMAQLETRAAIKDRDAPATMARARVYTAKNLTAGLGAVLTRLRLGTAVWDPNRDAILAGAPGLQIHVPKAYVRWTTPDADVVVGSFRAGFGERLTFDNSFDYTPNGLYADDQIYHVNYLVRGCKEGTGELSASPCPSNTTYVTPDFTWRDGLFGVGAGARHIDAGDGWLQLYGWASDHQRSIYQYELYDTNTCADPRADTPECSAPPVLRHPDGNILTPTNGYNYEVVPDVFREAVVGGNATYFLDHRTYLGITGYGAQTDDLLKGSALSYQEWSNRPSGPRFGALGATAAFGIKTVDVGAELARSFDDMHPTTGDAKGGGGYAATVRATVTGHKQVIEATARYYGVDYVNPFSRPIAAPDEFEGQRARDEVGGRVRYNGQRGDLLIRAAVEAWDLIVEKVPRTDDYVRLDYAIDAPVGWGLWLEYSDKDLTAGGRGQCYETEVFVDEVTGAPELCKGMRLSTTARLHLNPNKKLRVTGQLTHKLLDDPKHPNGFRNDVQAWVIALYKATDRIRVHGRMRYLFQDVTDNTNLEQSLWAYADATFKLRSRDSFRVRADAYWWLDDRSSTMTRAPNPELWLWLEYVAKF